MCRQETKPFPKYWEQTPHGDCEISGGEKKITEKHNGQNKVRTGSSARAISMAPI